MPTRRIAMLIGMSTVIQLLFWKDPVWGQVLSWISGATGFLGTGLVGLAIRFAVITLLPAYAVLRFLDLWYQVPEDSNDVLRLGGASLALPISGLLPLPMGIVDVVRLGLRMLLVVLFVRVLMQMSMFQPDQFKSNYPSKRINAGMFLLVLLLVPALVASDLLPLRKVALFLHLPRFVIEVAIAVGLTIVLFVRTKLKQRVIDPTLGRGLLATGTCLYLFASLVGAAFLAFIAATLGAPENSWTLFAPLVVIAMLSGPILFGVKWLLLLGAVRLLSNLAPDSLQPIQDESERSPEPA